MFSHIRKVLLFLIISSILIFITPLSWSECNIKQLPTQISEVDIKPIEQDTNHINNYFLSIVAPFDHDISVDYQTVDGIAIAGQDYISSTGTATIEAGKTSVLIGVEIIGDTISESEEQFFLELSNPIGANFPSGTTKIIVLRTIIDDDSGDASVDGSGDNSFSLQINTDPNITNKYYTNGALNLPITIKETAKLGANNYPISVIVPLPQSRYFETNEFMLVDELNKPINAQFEVVNKWWGNDNSLRHIKIYFKTSIVAFTSCETGTRTVYLRDNINIQVPEENLSNGLQVIENKKTITINTGPLKFTVNKEQFSILEQVWLDKNKDGIFDNSEAMLQANAQKGGLFTGRLSGDIQVDSERTDIKVIIEESGPQRVVIRAEALTHYKNTEDHQHGFAVRIYAYAGQSFVKVDYQLQNSSKDTKYAWPLYFEEMGINLPLNFNSEPTITIGNGTDTPFTKKRGNGIEIAQESHNIFKIRELSSTSYFETGTYPEGFIDISNHQFGVTAVTRNFWQMWANGLSIDKDDHLLVQLFPKWSAQWHKHEISETGLYWLQDMQHVYKEVLFNFHNGKQSSKEKINLAKTFQSYPVATLPTGWYQETRATLDMGGIIPFDKKIATADTRQISYPEKKYDGQYYMFNWVNFGANEPGYRVKSCTTGGWPQSASNFIATENPSDYFNAELFALDDINIRPQSIAGYSHSNDFSLLSLTENPYCGATWRSFEGHGHSTYDNPLIEGTGKYYYARDEAHGWHYFTEEAFYFTGNLWIKDWYQFIAQFKRIRLTQKDPFPHTSQRAIGHAISNALQAYRVTGDQELLDLIGEFISNYLRNNVVAVTGGTFKKDAAFMAGFLTHSLISYMNEIKYTKPQLWAESFQLLSGIMNWNLQYCNFCYHSSTLEPFEGKSSGASTTFTDPQAWYGWTTGQKDYIEHLNEYINNGINGGGKPYGEATAWKGDFNGRTVQFIYNKSKSDSSPPSPVTNLSSTEFNNNIIVSWTGVADASRYHIIWDTKPLSSTPQFDSTKTNWFAANVIGQFTTKQVIQSTQISKQSQKIYIAIYSFDASGNMSKLSEIIEQ